MSSVPTQERKTKIVVFDRKLVEEQNYWREKLRNRVLAAGVPYDISKVQQQSPEYSSYSFNIDGIIYKNLLKLTDQAGLLLYTVLLSSVQICLHRYNDSSRIAVGSPPRGETSEPNILCLISELLPSSYKDYLTKLLQVVKDAYSKQSYPLELLLRDLNMTSEDGRCPLFDVVLELSGFNGRPCGFNGGLLISACCQKDNIRIQIRFNSNLYTAQRVEMFSAHIKNVLAVCLQKPQTLIADIELLSKEERCQLLDIWNQTRKDYSGPQFFISMFEDQAEKTPAAPAVLCGEEILTYGELNARANQLACHLIELGVRPEIRVGLFVTRSPEMLVGLLAVLKTGGAYVPIDSKQPEQRISFLLQDSKIGVILTLSNLQSLLPAFAGKVVHLDNPEFRGISKDRKFSNPENSTDPLNLAYVLYTSGSTGRPKGVMIPQRGLTNYLNWCVEAYQLREGEGALVHSPLGFDLTITGLLAPLAVGQKVVLVEESEGFQALEKAFRKGQNYSLVKITPAHLEVLSQLVSEKEAGGRARAFVIGGEALFGESLKYWRRHAPETRLINEYGPTETVVGCCVHEVAGDEDLIGAVAIGRPIANTQLYVLDGELRPTPVGMVGELYIGGNGVGRGYINDPEQTAERFVPNPFVEQTGSRMYRTGDLVKYLADGRLVYLGRSDHQVKVRGYRIELGEIEAILSQHDAVREAIVVVREDRLGEKRLAGYVAGKGKGAIPTNELRSYLQGKLPEYMIPTAFVMLDKFPLTANGKVDRQALPLPDESRPGLAEKFVKPRTTVEEKLVGIWREVLRLEEVGIHDNFFELGGHSLLATQMVSRVREAFGVELLLLSLFESPTIAGLGEKVETKLRVGEMQIPTLGRKARTGNVPLSYAQERLWFVDQFQPESAAYNLPGVLRIRGKLQVEVLERVINEILRRHEVLRTTFTNTAEGPVQVIHEHMWRKLPVVDLTGRQEAVQEEERFIREESRRPFDLARGPVVRITLLRLNAEEHTLLYTMHHIASDGWSMGILLQEFEKLYAAFSKGEPSPLAELPIQYADFAVWQREWLQGEVLEKQINYWKKQLGDAPSLMELPTDRPRPVVEGDDGAVESVKINRELALKLNRLSQREGVTLFMTLLAAFKMLLHRYTGRTDIVVGTSIANRNRAEIEPLIGFFVNMMALRTDLSGNPSFLELLRRVREVALGADAHQDLPFGRIVKEVQPERALSYLQLFRVGFDFNVVKTLNQPNLFSGIKFDSVMLQNKTAKYDLALTMSEVDQDLIAGVEYRTELFDSSTIVRLLKNWEQLLDMVVRNPEVQLSEVQILSGQERRQLLVEWNQTQTKFPINQTYPQLFEEQVKRTPEIAAARFQGREISYAELNRRANQLAHYLQSLGVGPDVLVGVYFERSLELPVALLGILKAGGAYLPLDPAYPAERLNFMLEDSGAEILLAMRQDHELPLTTKVKLICLNSDWELISQQPEHTPENRLTVENLAYVIYTSGSTGRPKGVLITHQSLLNHNFAMMQLFALKPGERVLQFASMSFDISVEELFPSWLSGCTIVFRTEEMLASMSAFMTSVENERISIINLPTAFWHELVKYLPEIALPKAVRLLVIGGEAAKKESYHVWCKNVGSEVQLINTYGPTEATVTATWFRLGNSEPEYAGEHYLSIGRPLANTQIYILDPHGNPVPVGVAGEICIGGSGLARCYLNRPELTAEKFIINPFADEPGARLYKTGDLARYLSNGNIEFLGRLDNQVKIRGFRIETEEVERVLKCHPAVRDVLVMAREDELRDISLVGYIVGNKEAEDLSKEKLRSYLQHKLPPYMVPSFFVILESLPMTPNGKIDRKSLPAPSLNRERVPETLTKPRTPVEEKLAHIWQQVLELDLVGMDENFFELGGHSLLATQVMSRVRETFEVELPLRNLFENPTVGTLGGVITWALKEKQAAKFSDPVQEEGVL